MDFSGERIWAEVSLQNICHNFRLAQQLCPGSICMPVVKADAYGHGAVPVARALCAAGAQRFAVATAAEAMELREAGVNTPLLVLGAVPPVCIPTLAAADVAVCVTGLDCARQYAGQLAPGVFLRVHFKLDSGMARLGARAATAAEELRGVAALPGLLLEGLFTHFAVSDEDTQQAAAFTQGQYAALVRLAQGFEGPRPMLHAANSGGVLYHAYSHADLVRPGILLYGYTPGGKRDSRLLPALSLRARVADVHTLTPGGTVSYGRTFTAQTPCTVATVCAGYADGLMRGGSGKIEMLVNGRRALQVGRICMDMCMLDVTGIPGVQAGDTATIIGRDGEERITADELATHNNTISYEVLCAISKRVPRFYTEE